MYHDPLAAAAALLVVGSSSFRNSEDPSMKLSEELSAISIEFIGVADSSLTCAAVRETPSVSTQQMVLTRGD